MSAMILPVPLPGREGVSVEDDSDHRAYIVRDREGEIARYEYSSIRGRAGAHSMATRHLYAGPNVNGVYAQFLIDGEWRTMER